MLHINTVRTDRGLSEQTMKLITILFTSWWCCRRGPISRLSVCSLWVCLTVLQVGGILFAGPHVGIY